MWESISESLAKLRALDTQCQAFGAEAHQYQLKPPVSDLELHEFERKIGTVLPESLRTFYQEVGNGGAGPFYGLWSLQELVLFRPEQEFFGVPDFPTVIDDDAVPGSGLAGLLGIIDYGCGEIVCIATKGRYGDSLVQCSPDFGALDCVADTLPALYESWLNRELGMYEMARAMMISGADYDEIETALEQEFQYRAVGDIISSLTDTAKPVELFGSADAKTYHGTTQIQWYRTVLREWQDKNGVQRR